MSFVKLDCGILDSTLWVDRAAREIFVTALLMADPHEVRDPMEQINVRDLTTTGFVVPVGWYGFVHAAGPGIVRRAGLEIEEGLAALERLGAPEPESRSPEHEGRRLVRVNGGYIVLNFAVYREKDHGAAERMRVYRAKQAALRRTVTPLRRTVTEAEAEAEAEADKKSTSPTPSKFKIPTLEEVKLCCAKTGLPDSDAVWFWNKEEGNGWTNGGKKIKSWPHTIAAWKAAGYMPSQKNNQPQRPLDYAP